MAFFTGKRVMFTGTAITIVAASVLLHGGSRVGALVGEGFFLLGLLRPQLFNFLANFAEPTAWPSYVGAGVAALFAAHFGGIPACVVVGGLLVQGDGRMFDALY